MQHRSRKNRNKNKNNRRDGQCKNTPARYRKAVLHGGATYTAHKTTYRSEIHRAVREVGQRPVPNAPELRRIRLLPQERVRPAVAVAPTSQPRTASIQTPRGKSSQAAMVIGDASEAGGWVPNNLLPLLLLLLDPT